MMPVLNIQVIVISSHLTKQYFKIKQSSDWKIPRTKNKPSQAAFYFAYKLEVLSKLAGGRGRSQASISSLKHLNGKLQLPGQPCSSPVPQQHSQGSGDLPSRNLTRTKMYFLFISFSSAGQYSLTSVSAGALQGKGNKQPGKSVGYSWPQGWFTPG